MAAERTTIRELARLSGVSIGTVSRALNGYADVGPETRERIIAPRRGARLHAGRSGQHPRHPALARRRRLPRHRRGPPRLQHPFFQEVLVGLKHDSAPAGTTCCCSRASNPETVSAHHSYLKRCRHHRVDGVVLMGVEHDDAEVQRLARSAIPASRSTSSSPARAPAYVISDNAAGGAARGSPPARARPRADRDDRRPARDDAGPRPPRGYRAALETPAWRYRDDYVALRRLLLRERHRGDAGASCPRRAADGGRSRRRT